MFKVNKKLARLMKEKIIKSSIVLDSAKVCYADGCPCKGACGTYVPPCGNCAYHN